MEMENYFVNIEAGAHRISQPLDRHHKVEIEPRHPSLEVTWLNLSPAMQIRWLRVHHVIGWASAPMLIKCTLEMENKVNSVLY
jgi:cytochrome oxidase assembly protein ShyY1